MAPPWSQPHDRQPESLSTEVPVGPANGIGHESVVSCDNIVTIEKAALGERIGYLFPVQERLLTAAIRAAFDLE